MLRYKIESHINDGLAEAPPLEVEVESVDQLVDQLIALDSFTNDYGDVRNVGATVTITRVA